MTVQEILDQLFTIYGQPTLAAMELNNVVFRIQYSVADALEVLFRRIKNCAKIVILGQNPYTDCQLINNVIRLLLLTTGLYQRPFKEWDRLLPTTQTWIALQAHIQKAFHRCLNATAPTAGHHGYAPPHPNQQNAFGILGKDDDDNKANTVASQVAALMYQSQLTQSTAANTRQHQEHQMAQLSAVQDVTHVSLHQLTDGMNVLMFNASNAGRVGTLKDGYIHKVPLPWAPWIQHASHASHVTRDICYLAQVPRIPTWSDLTRSLAKLGRRALLPFPLLLV